MHKVYKVFYSIPLFSEQYLYIGLASLEPDPDPAHPQALAVAPHHLHVAAQGSHHLPSNVPTHYLLYSVWLFVQSQFTCFRYSLLWRAGSGNVSAMLTAAALGPDWSAGQQSWRWTAGRSPGCCANIAGWGRPATESQPSASVFSRTGLLHQNQVVNNISEFLPTIRVRVGWQPKIEDSGEVNCVIIQGELLSSNHPGRCRLHTCVSRQQNRDLGSNDAVNVGLST